MKKNIYKKLFVAFAALLLLTGFYAVTDIYFDISKNMDLFGKIYKEVAFNYVDDIDPEKFMEAGIQGMLGSLDPYTVYLDENKKDEIELITNGKYGGIGISVGVRNEKVTVMEVYDGYAAQRQGIRIGDVIIEANGEKVDAESSKDLTLNVKGEPGTKVNVKILRNSGKDTVNFNLVREEIIVKNVPYYGFYPEGSNNAYVKLSGFGRSAGEEIRKALKDLSSKKEIKSVVLDLRGNPGGLLDVAVDISNKFLPEKSLIVSTKGRTPESEKKFYADQQPMLPNARLILLVNENSASASEIVAGAIQDNDRGVIIGNKTYGKGLVQTVTPLSFNTSVKITTARYYTPSGRSIQKIDYSKKNNVTLSSTPLDEQEYLTTKKRHVFGAGGITPDSIVDYKIESNLTKDLLAKGTFFEYADKYYYSHQDADFTKLNDEKLLAGFKDFLVEQKYKYHSDAEKEVQKLIDELNASNTRDEFSGVLENLRNQIESLGTAEMKIFRNEILREIKAELASRYFGNDGRIVELLKNDIQFRSALDVLNNDKLYRKLLNSVQ